MDSIFLFVVAAVGLLVFGATAYLWYLTSGVEESERLSTGGRS